MQCPRCGTDNVLGVSFCRGCGGKLELTDDQAQQQAIASVKHDNWKKAFGAMFRTLYFFTLALIGALAFRSCARHEIVAEFGPPAPLPPAPPLVLNPGFVDLPDLDLPTVAEGHPLEADGDATHQQIIEGLAATAQQRLNCIVARKNAPPVRGQLLSRSEKELKVITSWTKDDPPRPIVRTVPANTVDFQRSQLP
jgi:hypothetical protein